MVFKIIVTDAIMRLMLWGIIPVVMCIPNVIKTKGYVQKIAETIIGNSYSKSVPKTGLEPARLSALAPETSASTIPPLGQVSYCHF